MAASVTTQYTNTIVQEILWILTMKVRLLYSQRKAAFYSIQHHNCKNKAWLLLDFSICLRNQLSSIHYSHISTGFIK